MTGQELVDHVTTLTGRNEQTKHLTRLNFAQRELWSRVDWAFSIKNAHLITTPIYEGMTVDYLAETFTALKEAFTPVLEYLRATYNLSLDHRVISFPATLLLVGLILKKGADIGVRLLWVVCTILLVSLTLFFLGKGAGAGAVEYASIPLTDHVRNPDSFARVFAICFPAFTGMTAGVGLSGDLKNPGRSIPMGTLMATLTGMVVYVSLVIKLAGNASPEDLAANQLIMGDIALWGPIIPIGLAAATISSGLGSILIAPRTLQALARDRLMPVRKINALLALGRGKENEPVNATLVSGIIALAFVIMGDVNFVAQIISMFFMVTYGAICTISFLEHFAGNPSYRPSFRSRWYLSLLGGVMCFMMMFQMSPLYALVSIVIMVIIYQGLQYTRKGERTLAVILQGVAFQLTRRLHIAVQKSRATANLSDWRPSILGLTRDSTSRLGHFDLLRWICHRHGFGQFIHFVEGNLSADSNVYAARIMDDLIQRTQVSGAGVFVDTIIAPNFTTALTSMMQVPGISGMRNNTVLFEFPKDHFEEAGEIAHGARLAASLDLNICILRSSPVRFGYRKQIHIWLTEEDYANAPLMILLAYILTGHSDWDDAHISVFACYPAERIEQEVGKLDQMVAEGRLPITSKNIWPIPYEGDRGLERSAEQYSSAADLVIMGLHSEAVSPQSDLLMHSYRGLNDILFVQANQAVTIS